MFQLRMQFTNSLLENLNRSDYESDEAYINAAINGAERIVNETVKNDDEFFEQVKAEVKAELEQQNKEGTAKEFQLGQS